MKIKDGFVLRTVMGQHIIVAEGPQHVNFNKMISLNYSAALLWENVVGKDFTVQDLAEIIGENYKVDEEQVLADVKDIAEKWIENGLVDA